MVLLSPALGSDFQGTSRGTARPTADDSCHVGHVNSLLYITDKSTGHWFLVDTGAGLSALPPHSTGNLNTDPTPTLRAANGSAIKTYGTRRAQIQIEDEKFTWRFVLASVGTTLLGADCLRAHGLLVDVRSRRLLNVRTFRSVRLGTMDDDRPKIATVATATDEFTKILSEFPAILEPCFDIASPRHGVFHYISTKGPPLHARARRLPPEKLKQAKEEFSRLQELGIIRRLDSAWAAQLHMVLNSSRLDALQRLLFF
ncbi:uncharacterized protein [Narcine bancroftii]|uniref:uncharacterized protein n=1 Tax=Narcine bancroftii TaxID=1343680 RepID=UPI00383125DB